MINLRLIEKKVDKNPIFSRKFEVKEGKRIFAKIYHRVNGKYSVEINGATWIKNSLFECVEHINEMSGRLFFQNVEIVKLNPDLK